jgi:hypothetical protein
MELYWGSGVHWWAWCLWLGLMLVFWALVIWAIVALVRWAHGGHRGPGGRGGPGGPGTPPGPWPPQGPHQSASPGEPSARRYGAGPVEGGQYHQRPRSFAGRGSRS